MPQDKRLTTSQLSDLLSRNPATRNVFRGVYAADLLPNFSVPRHKRPALIIANTQASDYEGQHWVLIWVPLLDSDPVYAFDSFGNSLEDNQYISLFLRRHSRNGHHYNKFQFQDDSSNTCGKFVLAVAFLLASGVAPQLVASFFSKTSTRMNERNVADFIRIKFGLT